MENYTPIGGAYICKLPHFEPTKYNKCIVKNPTTGASVVIDYDNLPTVKIVEKQVEDGAFKIVGKGGISEIVEKIMKGER